MKYEIQIIGNLGEYNALHLYLDPKLQIMGFPMIVAFFDRTPEWWIVQNPVTRHLSPKAIANIGPFDSAVTALVHLKLIAT